MEERRLTLRELRILHEIEKDLHEDPAFVDRFEQAEMPEPPQPQGHWTHRLRWLFAGFVVVGVCVLFAAATPAVGLLVLAAAAAGRMAWRLGRAVGRRRSRRRGAGP
jgi:Flp pilus assembly protein TadB